MQVAKWGNSLAIRLPAAVVEALDLHPGDEVIVRASNAREFEVARKPTRADLLARLDAYRGTLPEDFIFDREQANARAE
jgi:antitoxin MazE